MKTKALPNLLPAILLGGLLFTPGCSTPSVTVGEPKRSDRVVFQVSSPKSSEVRCVWLQNGASIQHTGTTPFRVVLPASAVDRVTLIKAVQADDVVVEVRSPRGEPGHFVMSRGASTIELLRNSRRWEERVF